MKHFLSAFCLSAMVGFAANAQEINFDLYGVHVGDNPEQFQPGTVVALALCSAESSPLITLFQQDAPDLFNDMLDEADGGVKHDF